MAALDKAALDTVVALAGARAWSDRIAALLASARHGPRSGRALRQLHVFELTIERLRQGQKHGLSEAEGVIAGLAVEIASLADALSAAGRERLRARLRAALRDEATLIPLVHLVRTGMLQRSRGFEAEFVGLAEQAPFDLLVACDRIEVEVACDVASAEDGRGVHRGAWFRLADRIDPDLQTWLAAHPGRYLLKMTLPQGLQEGPAADESLAGLHGRIRAMLSERRRSDSDAAVVLRLDPLLLAGAQAGERGLLTSLRHEFGPEAHLSVTAGGDGVFVMAARAGQENAVASAIRRRMAAVAPERFTGTRPGILAMFVEDTDGAEWRGLRENLELEGEARGFLAEPAARQVVAVTCASRIELFARASAHAAPEGELRFRNPAHPAARAPELAPLVQPLV